MKQPINKPFYPFLLVIFFFLHALMENYNPVLIKTAGWLMIVYSAIALAIFILFKLFLKDWRKAALPAFCILAFNFFYGTVYDVLKRNFHDLFITKVSFILAITLILLLVLFVYLKKTNRKLLRLTQYLNILLILLILVDAVSILFIKKKDHVADLSGSMTNCDTCSHPDIYLLIMDEYAGNTELKDLLSFDNSPFENQLKERGFHIVNNSTSNYNATVYSMASMLNMDHIGNLDKNAVINHKDMLQCRQLISHNNLANYLQRNGYMIFNNTFFDIGNRKKVVNNLFYPSNTLLLTGQTFIRRFIRNAGARFVSKKKIDAIKTNDLHNDIIIDSLTRSVLQVSGKEKFVYAHFNMPHHPYFFDSSGNKTPVENLTAEFTTDKKAYTSYLQYSNKKILRLIDLIKTRSTKPPVIILMGDHGFRQMDGADKKYYFMNLNAVYLPNGDYSRFYDGMSNVNQFRVILNTVFNQKLPMLKDSTHFLTE